MLNGAILTDAQSMAIRVAIENFSMGLTTDGLGTDDTGKAICAGYLARIEEIRTVLYPRAGIEGQKPQTASTGVWRCPKCKSDDLDVQINTWARLDQAQLQDGSSDFSTNANEGQVNDHEWDRDSGMQCRDCGHTATVIEFEADIFECQNCGEGWTIELLKSISDISERVGPDEPEPAGECPNCGALCHKKEVTAIDSLPVEAECGHCHLKGTCKEVRDHLLPDLSCPRRARASEPLCADPRCGLPANHPPGQCVEGVETNLGLEEPR